MAYDPSYYNELAAQALRRYTENAAMNQYRRQMAETAGGRRIGEIEEAAFGQRREVPRLTSTYGRRGLYGQGIRSGLFNKALADYATQRIRNLAEARGGLATQMRGFDLTGSQLQSQYQDTLYDIERRRLQAIAEDAAKLANL